MKPIVIFGTGKIADVLLYFFQNHSDRQVVACTVDRGYVPDSQWNGLPTVPFDKVLQEYPPQTHEMFVALGYQDMNGLRADKCEQARKMGYKLVTYAHPDAGLPSDCLLGDNCFIMNAVHVHPCVQIGNNVFVWTGVTIGHHSVIGDNCWLTSSANISGVVNVGANCLFAVNATVGHGISIGEECFIGANALVVKSTNSGEAYLTESTKAFRLSSRQFLRMSNFSQL